MDQRHLILTLALILGAITQAKAAPCLTVTITGADRDSGMPAPIYYRQSATSDLGAMAQRAGAKHLVLTHLIPPPGAPQQGPWKVPGGALTEADYRKAAQDGGFGRNVIVATDLASLRLPVK